MRNPGRLERVRSGDERQAEKLREVYVTPLLGLISPQVHQEALRSFKQGNGSSVSISERCPWLLCGELTTGRGECCQETIQEATRVTRLEMFMAWTRRAEVAMERRVSIDVCDRAFQRPDQPSGWSSKHLGIQPSPPTQSDVSPTPSPEFPCSWWAFLSSPILPPSSAGCPLTPTAQSLGWCYDPRLTHHFPSPSQGPVKTPAQRPLPPRSSHISPPPEVLLGAETAGQLHWVLFFPVPLPGVAVSWIKAGTRTRTLQGCRDTQTTMCHVEPFAQGQALGGSQTTVAHLLTVYIRQHPTLELGASQGGSTSSPSPPGR